MKHNLKIKVDARGQGTIELDGRDISGLVVAVGFNTSPDEPTEVTLVMTPDMVEIEAEIDEDRLREPALTSYTEEAGHCVICYKDATGPRVQPANVLLCNQCVRDGVIP